LVGLGKLLEKLLGQIVCELMELSNIKELEIQVALRRGATVIPLSQLLWGLLDLFVLI
jgi:hypothetical protein